MEKKHYTIAELEEMVHTHNILPDGSVVKKNDMAKVFGKSKKKQTKKIRKIKKSNKCICMDCGKIIKIKGQSKHLKECPRKAISKMIKGE